MTRRPEALVDGEIPLGWAVDSPVTVGFATLQSRPQRPIQQLLALAGDGHICTIARTGSGKGRSCTIPWLLTLPDPVVVLDIKAEAYHCTARWRREQLGHRIYTIDPFGMVGGTDRLDPCSLARAEHIEEDADLLTELLIDGRPTSTKDPFWDIISRAFLLGCIAHILTASSKPTMRQLRDLLQQDDVTLAIATLLDEKKVVSQLAQREFATFLNHEKDKVRPSVLSTAQQHLRVLSGEASLRVLENPTLSLDEVLRGESFTIYLIIPPEYLTSHGPLLRLLVGTLMHAITRRTRRPRLNTVFLLDEIAQCGTLPILRQAMTLMRGYGMTTITLWQDLSQMQRLYEDWRTLLNNCTVIETFGASTYEMARNLGEVIGVAPEQLRDMPAENAMISVPGQRPFQARRLDYLSDRMFAGKSSPNPWFSKPEPPPQEPPGR